VPPITPTVVIWRGDQHSLTSEVSEGFASETPTPPAGPPGTIHEKILRKGRESLSTKEPLFPEQETHETLLHIVGDLIPVIHGQEDVIEHGYSCGRHER
jgi:hypothetical protein